MRGTGHIEGGGSAEHAFDAHTTLLVRWSLRGDKPHEHPPQAVPTHQRRLRNQQRNHIVRYIQ